ncbi:hypothetical protein ACJX0J_028845, partial [Zea mays]
MAQSPHVGFRYVYMCPASASWGALCIFKENIMKSSICIKDIAFIRLLILFFLNIIVVHVFPFLLCCVVAVVVVVLMKIYVINGSQSFSGSTVVKPLCLAFSWEGPREIGKLHMFSTHVRLLFFFLLVCIIEKKKIYIYLKFLCDEKLGTHLLPLTISKILEIFCMIGKTRLHLRFTATICCLNLY